jgi:UDP-glucuronate 4-epimerase
MAYFKFTRAILAGKPIDLYNGGDMLRDFTYIDDVTSCVEKMLFVPPKPDETGAPYAVYNIGNNQPVKLIDFIRALEAALGRKAELNFLPMQAGDVMKTYADIEATQRDFGFRPETQIQEGLKRFTDWYLAYYD